ncbi:MAG: recombination protein NinB [Pseudomonadota bacterium]|nr:recombination protein NinB [Pseudomonadota bacterium]
MSRDIFLTRTILLRSLDQVKVCHRILDNLPVDPDHPLQVKFSEQQKIRTPDQNALMWSGPLRDISEQGWVNGQTFSADAWHYQFKVWFLPEEAEEGITKEGYRKWDISPRGERILVGSTTDLLTKGFSNYLEQVYAYGAGELGVRFSTKEDGSWQGHVQKP